MLLSAGIPVLNQQAIDDIRELDDEGGLLAELTELFLQDAVQSVDQMQQAIANTDLQKLRQCAHKMKSGAGNIGAARVAEACKQLEEAARQQDSVPYISWVDSLKGELETARSALQSL
jgi:HPt (histidine-containing phosphotransfer) domain-containing protein